MSKQKYLKFDSDEVGFDSLLITDFDKFSKSTPQQVRDDVTQKSLQYEQSQPDLIQIKKIADEFDKEQLKQINKRKLINQSIGRRIERKRLDDRNILEIMNDTLTNEIINPLNKIMTQGKDLIVDAGGQGADLFNSIVDKGSNTFQGFSDLFTNRYVVLASILLIIILLKKI